MAAQSIGASAPTILPTSINWVCVSGIILEHERRTADELVSSGLLTPDEIPENRSKQSRDGACRVFSTVLSPDYNAAHRDHLHLDTANRGPSGWRACR